MARFNAEKKNEALLKNRKNGLWEKNKPWQNIQFMNYAVAINKYNNKHKKADPKFKEYFPNFIWDVFHKIKGKHPRVNDRNGIEGVRNMAEVFVMRKTGVIVGIELKSTFKHEFDARQKGTSAGIMFALNSFIRTPGMAYEIMEYSNKLGFAITPYLQEIDLTSLNPTGVIGFNIDLSNMKKINYDKLFLVFVKVWDDLITGIDFKKLKRK